CQQHYDSPPAF
nr:immunoglobulin light chain junction region [Macaca mulatta]